MTKITILYPANPGDRFDYEYYETVNMPLSIGLLGSAVRSVTVGRGVPPGSPWPAPAFHAICSFVCESLETYQRAFVPHMERMQRDMPNYTDIEAVVQVGDIVIEHATDVVSDMAEQNADAARRRAPNSDAIAWVD